MISFLHSQLAFFYHIRISIPDSQSLIIAMAVDIIVEVLIQAACGLLDHFGTVYVLYLID